MLYRLARPHAKPESKSFRDTLLPANGFLSALLKTTQLVVGDRMPATVESTDPAARDLPIHALLDEAPAILFIASQDGVIQYCNNFLLSYSGLSPAHAARTAVIDLIHPRDRRLVAAASARAASGLAQLAVSCRLLGKSGEYKRFLVRVSPLQRDDTTWWCGVGTEVEDDNQKAPRTSQAHEELGALLDSVSDCYVAVDGQRRIIALNRPAAAWLGLSPSSVIGKDLGSIADLTSLIADSAEAQLTAMKALEGMVEDAIHHRIQGYKQIHSSLFSGRWADVRVTPFNQGALVSFKDVTSQKSDQLRLSRSQGLIQLALDTLPGRIAILDNDGVIIAVNKAWRAFQQQQIGPISGATVGANYRNHCESQQIQEGLEGALRGNGVFRTSYDLDLAAGKHWYQASIATFEQSEFLRIVVSHEDVTELVNVRQSVADLQSRLICLQENERQRIAMELHDSTAQYLVAAGLSLGRVKDLPIEERAQVICEEVDSLLDEALKELRTFTYLLHPIALSNEGLIASLHRFAQGLERRSSLEIDLSLDADIDLLPFDFQRNVLRITQEALANAHRHAAATRVDLRIDIQDRELHLRVRDNGRGMPEVPWTDLESGVGISGMQARVAQFGGKIDFPSGPHGTTVIATIPIPENFDLVPALSSCLGALNPAHELTV